MAWQANRTLNEKYLITGLKTKNKVIFDFIFNFYYSGLCAYARKWIGSAEIAEDLVQDFFVRLWTNSQKLEITSSLKSYLFTSVKNTALNHLKHAKIRELYAIQMMQSASENEGSANWEFTESELTEIIEKGMAKLPPRCREIFILNRFNGKDNREIAEMLGISKRTVELQISNALRILRIELKDYLPSILLLYLLNR